MISQLYTLPSLQMESSRGIVPAPGTDASLSPQFDKILNVNLRVKPEKAAG